MGVVEVRVCYNAFPGEGDLWAGTYVVLDRLASKPHSEALTKLLTLSVPQFLDQ